MASALKLITPYNTSEFHELVRQARTHNVEIHDELHTIAVDLRQLLANPKGTRFGGMRVDLKLNAVRVARHIEHAAAAELAAAKSMTAAYRVYLDLYTKQGSVGASRSFDVDR